MKQGAWTDLYALASVMHYAISGQTPPPAVQRFLSDKYIPLAKLAATRYSLPFLQALDRALAVLPQDRPQTVAEMRALLGQHEPTQAPPARTSATAAFTPAPAPTSSAAAAPAGSGGSFWKAPTTAPSAAPREPTLGAQPTRPPRSFEPLTTGAFSALGTGAGAAARTVSGSGDFTVVPTRAPVAAPRSPPVFDDAGSSDRRKFALAGAAVAAAIGASAGLVYLLVQYTEPESSATIHYRAGGSESATPSEAEANGTHPAAGEAASSPPALAHAPQPAPPVPAAPQTQETLGASGTSTPTADDPAPNEPLQAGTSPARPEAAAAAAPPPPPAAQQAAPPSPTQVAAQAARPARGSTASSEKRALDNPVTSSVKPGASRRCIDIIQRVSLGEPLTTEERDILKQECGQ
jgi:hypothetical protein